ncbi:hypothetical protein [Trujillonella endophytica]|uniref:PQQ-like domain-containing protein n=1 Tax=Trujillonella endophytica TaxID=673521 RepID=A0A1H8VKM2_9ACTN|nr:hypothetical protein [Trujillella endophytica]SEP15757.1 hypothetical protein SAMN05660991_03621 [Trujillella endophytica]
MRARLLGVLAAATALATAACTTSTGGQGGPGGPATLERAVALADDVEDADLVAGVTVTADGTALVWTLGAAGRAGVTVVDLPENGSPAVAGDTVRLQDVELDLALTAGGETLLVGRVGSPYDGRYAVLAVDPASGDVLDTRPVAGTEDAGQVEAAALPDGTVVVAGDRPGGLPFVLLVAPLEGRVISAAAIDVSDVADAADRVRVDALTVSPDGTTIAVTLAVRGEDGSAWTPAVAVLETDPFSPGDVVALDGDGVSALAVSDDGIAYVATEGTTGLAAVDAATGTVREVPGEPGLGEVTGLAVVGDDVVAVDRRLRVVRLDPADGSATAVADLCDDTGAAAGVAVAPDGSLVVAANCAGAGLWVLPA